MSSNKSDVLRKQVREYMAAFDIGQRELSRGLAFSATALNQWLNRKYPHDPAALEAALERWMSQQNPEFIQLSRADKRRLAYILDLLNHADNKAALLAQSTVIATQGPSATDRPAAVAA